MNSMMFRSLLCALILTCNLTWSQSLNENHWIETTVQDFADGSLENVIIANTSGGEIRLPEPIKRVAPESIEPNTPRFAAYDSTGCYLQLILEDAKLFGCFYSPDHVPLDSTFQISPEGYTVYGDINDSWLRCAWLESDQFLIIWAGRAPESGETCFFGQVIYRQPNWVASHFRLFSVGETHYHIPAIFIDHEQNRILIFSTKHNKDYLVYQELNIQTKTLSDTSRIKIGPEVTSITKVNCIIQNNEDQIVIAWEGQNDNGSGAFIQYYNEAFQPLSGAIRLSEDESPYWKKEASACFDAASNLFVVWEDARNYNSDLYGQLFSPQGEKIGSNIKINTDSLGVRPEVTTQGNQFQVSWQWSEFDSTTIYTSLWETQILTEGRYISSVFDAGATGTQFTNLLISAERPENSLLKFSLRSSSSADSISEKPWFGPSTGSDYYTQIDVPLSINPIHQGGRYIQYQAFFEKPVSGNTPILNAIEITFLPVDTIAPLPPVGLVATPAEYEIVLSWNQSDALDILKYRLYRKVEYEDGEYSQLRELPSSATEFHDPGARLYRQYTYCLTAVDSSHNESDFSNEVQAIPMTKTYWVNSYSTGGDGSEGAPFGTISEAIETAEPFSVVKVMPGAYEENLILDKKIALIGSGPNYTTLTGVGRFDPVIRMDDAQLIKDFKIVKQTGNEDVAIFCNSPNSVIAGNLIYNNGNGYMGILISGDTCRVFHNLISNFQFGVSVIPEKTLGYKRFKVIQISNNLITHEKGRDGIGIDLRIEHSGYEIETNIFNNVIIMQRSEDSGILYRLENLTASLSWIQIFNNIIVNETGTGIQGNDPSIDELFIDYNDVFTISGEPFVFCPQGIHNITDDPQFVNADGMDYHLQPGSPCIDQGHPGEEHLDLDGSRNDMGVFGGPNPFYQNMLITPSVSLKVASLSAFRGDTIQVPVSLSNLATLARAQATIEFDAEVLSFFSVQNGAALSDFQLNYNSAISGQIEISLETEIPVLTGEGVLFTLEFIVNTDPNSSEFSSLTIKDYSFLNSEGLPLQLREVIQGAFMVNPLQKEGSYLYVDAASDSGGDGSFYHPFNTILDGIDVVAAGDTVCVSGGDYFEQIILKEGVYLLGAGALVTTVTVDFEHTPDLDETVIIGDVTTGGIEGFTLIQDGPFEVVISCWNSNPIIKQNRIVIPGQWGIGIGIDCFAHSSPVIEGNYFVSSGLGELTCISSFGAFPVIKNNSFNMIAEGGSIISCMYESVARIQGNQFTGSFWGSIINFQESSGILMNNFFDVQPEDISGMASVTSITARQIDSLIVYNNIFHGREAGSFGISIESGSFFKVVNNVVDTRERGVDIVADAGIFLNNICLGNQEYGIRIQSDAQIAYNNSWGNTLNYQECTPGEGSISFDPIFQDRDVLNYHLATESPCIDTGHPEVLYQDSDGSRNDMGAFGGPFGSAWPDFLNTSISIDSATVACGDTISLPIIIQNASDLAYARFLLRYDPDFCTITNAWTETAGSGFTLSKHDSANGVVRLNLSRLSGASNINGRIASVQIAVCENLEIGNKSTIEFDQIVLKNRVAKELNIAQIDGSNLEIIKSSVQPCDNLTPDHFYLYHNYPNPFNSKTSIRYTLAKSVQVNLRIYDLLGREVRILVEKTQKAGHYDIVWDATGFASGMYLVRLEAGSYRRTNKVLYLK